LEEKAVINPSRRIWRCWDMGNNKEKKQMNNSLGKTARGINKIVKTLKFVEKQAMALGIFMNDRALLECPHCGMVEDVLSDGHLITYRDGEEIKDSGLRFTRLNNGRYRCPGCKSEVSEQINREEA